MQLVVYAAVNSALLCNVIVVNIIILINFRLCIVCLTVVDLTVQHFLIFTCVSYAEARLSYRLDVCLSVRLSVSVCLSHAGIVSKRLNILSCFLHHTIAHSFWFCVYQYLREIPTGSPPAGALNRGGIWKCLNFRPILTTDISLSISQKWLKIDGYMQRGVL